MLKLEKGYEKRPCPEKSGRVTEYFSTHNLYLITYHWKITFRRNYCQSTYQYYPQT